MTLFLSSLGTRVTVANNGQQSDSENLWGTIDSMAEKVVLFFTVPISSGL